MFIPMINIIIIKFYYLQIQEYEILKYNNIIIIIYNNNNNNNNNNNDIQ